MKVFKASCGQGRYLVEARAVACGKSVSAAVGGGTHYHIGAAALAVPRPSLASEDKISASASVICVTGHKEDEIARRAALFLASSLNCIVNISVGLHIDNAGPEEINMLSGNFFQVIKELEKVLHEYFAI